MEEENNSIYEICKQFLDMVFIDGDTYLAYLENKSEIPEDDSEDDKISEETMLME